MNLWLLKRTDQGGGYVAVDGHPHSYTGDVCYARLFRTRESAEKSMCKGNETPIKLESVLHGLKQLESSLLSSRGVAP